MAEPLPDAERQRRLAALAKHHPSIAPAARELGMKPQALRQWKSNEMLAPCAAPAPREPEEPLAVRQERKLLDKIATLRKELDKANRALNDAEDLREAVFGLGEPIDPASYRPRLKQESARHGEEIPVLVTSDFQWGEVIDLEEMGGLNAFNKHIAAARYRRLIEGAISCALRDNLGKPPPAFYYLRGGDAISGSIHEELAETNDLSSVPAIRDLASHERWGIATIRKELDCPVHVVSVPGNHDRTTHKSHNKGYVRKSFDSFISWHLEMCFEGDPDVTFLTPPSPDAFFTVHDTNFVLTHGDNMGVGGGTGYIGAVAAITKGHRKVVESYLHAGVRVDCVISGHFHTAVETEYGLGNGCLPGLSEFANLKIRPKPSPPVQWLLAVHPERGITTRRKLLVAAPGEGSLYERRAA
jgi:hypothetical protein